MLDHLIPVSKSHSIGKVVATVYLPQSIIKPKDIFDKMNEDAEIKNRYPKRNLLHTQSIEINEQKNTLNRQKDINGFIFESFDERGRLKNILLLQNQNDNKATFSFETRQYSNWDNFFKDIITEFKLFSEFYTFYVAAISLNYNDHFTWVNDSRIPVEEIFNTNSELIPNKFLKSHNGSLTLTSQELDENMNTGFEERTEISFSNTIRKVIINHHYVKRFDELESADNMLNRNGFKIAYEEAHAVNKQVLKDILSQEVQGRINLK